MSAPLQPFDHRHSSYERPTRSWECHSDDGARCRCGPLDGRHCGATAACQPVRRGDRWICTRPDAAGGPCAEGPLPDGRCAHPEPSCTPQPSWRRRRGRLSRWALLATLGVLLLLLAPGRWARWSSPGPVFQAHGDIASCDSCHGSAGRGPGSWLHAALTTTDPAEAAAPCLSCHQLGEQALSPHGLPTEVLAASSERMQQQQDRPPAFLALANRLLPVTASDSVPCASCHREHRGEQADLTRVDNDHCQGCHQVRFASFADGHPPFSGYPAGRRTHIVMDHLRHFTRHFPSRPEITAPTTCGGCHEPDILGRRMLVKPFAEACAPCHLAQIDGRDRTAGSRALPVLTVPGLDLDTLGAAGFSVGRWPHYADAEITPFVYLLLAGDASLRPALARAAHLHDLLDLRDASEAELEAVAQVAWAVKELLYDIEVSGAESLAARLERTTGQDLARSTLVELLAALPLDSVRAAREDWFPELLDEVSRKRAGQLPLRTTPAQTTAPAAAAPEPETTADTTQDDDDDLLSDNDDLLVAGGDDLLAEDGDLLAGADELLDDPFAEEIFGLAPTAENEAASAETLVELPAVDPEQWAALGGWYRSGLSLYYRPPRHGDAFMRSWLDLLGATLGSGAEPVTRPVFDALTDPLAPGSCGKCHSVDALPDGSGVVNWFPTRLTSSETRFTSFAHVTHFSVTGDDGCLFCHTINPEAQPLIHFEDHDPSSFESSFAEIAKERCTECHQPGIAGDACTQCHGYHAGITHTTTLGTELARAGHIP